MNRDQAHRAEPSSETSFDDVLKFIAEFTVFVLLVVSILGVVFIAWAGTR